MTFGVEPRVDLFKWHIKETLHKPDPTAYNLEGAFRPGKLRRSMPHSPRVLTDHIRSISPPSFGPNTFGVCRNAWDKVVS